MLLATPLEGLSPGDLERGSPIVRLSHPFPESAVNGPHLILPDICAVGMVSLADAVRLKYI